MNKRKYGEHKESIAAKWLEARGFKILEQNFRCKFGEIDIIAKDQNTIVFVEVKFRENSKSGFAEEAVSRAKQIKICKSADYYRMIHKITEYTGFRFDVIAITAGKLKHYENAFPYLGYF